jgi:hypothetical protein
MKTRAGVDKWVIARKNAPPQAADRKTRLAAAGLRGHGGSNNGRRRMRFCGAEVAVALRFLNKNVLCPRLNPRLYRKWIRRPYV